MNIDKSKIVAMGKCLYDGTIPCNIIIQKEDFFPGSGDYEDPPEIANDREIPCVSVWFQNPSKTESFDAGGGYYLTIDEAIKEIEIKIKQNINWERR